jgi:phage baseplate assembly protein W
MQRTFSIEDGDLQNKPITTSINRTYSDIDCVFAAKPSGDIYKKTDAAAVRQSVKNLLMTNRGEVPFNPYYGGNLNRFLFSLSSDIDEEDVGNAVLRVIKTYEPRARVLQVGVQINPEENSIGIYVEFKVLNYPQQISISVTIARTR